MSLSLHAFEGKFDVRELVSLLSEDLIARSKSEPGPFDPNPFIQQFELAVGQLISLRKDAQHKSDAMEQNVRLAERDYSRRMAELNGGFEAVGKSFNSMETRISDIGRAITRIGEQLEAVHSSRSRAQAAYDLVDYYTSFAKNDTTKLDDLRKEGGREGRRQVAVILRRLKVVSNEVEVAASDKASENIDKYCEKFENDTLRLFNKSYRKGDPKMMHHCAQTLLDFNGGASCVQMYVNQHDFFISKNRVEEFSAVENNQLWESLPDPDFTSPKVEPGLKALFGEVRVTVEQEVNIAAAVFPNPSLVMQVFLQRVFAQSLQQYMEVILNRASTLSTLSFLRMLHLCHVKTSELVNDLRAQDANFIYLRTPSFGDPTAAPSGTAAPSQSLSSMLESAMEELFVPYIEGQRYLEVEVKSLGELYSSYLARFQKYHKLKAPANSLKVYGMGLYEELTKSVTTKAAEVSLDAGSSRTAAMAANAFLKVAGKSSNLDRVKQEETVTDDDGRLNVEVAERMLKWHAEAIGRCVELSSPSEIAKNAFSLSKVLAEALGRSYIGLALETERVKLEVIRNELPEFSALEVVRHIDMICHLWQQYISIAVSPLSSAMVTIKREMQAYNNQIFSKIEGTMNTLLLKLADVIVNLLSDRLRGQQRADFKPKNDDLSFARVSTEPCNQCCDILERVCEAARYALSGKNLEVFLSDIGVSFHTLLLEHLKKFPISATGGLMLAKDLKAYQDTITLFGLPPLQERFEFIRQLGTLFLVQPESLESCISQGYLGRVDPSLLRPYLEKRSDWAQSAKLFDKDGAPVTEKGKYVARLGALMENFEGLKLDIPSLPFRA